MSRYWKAERRELDFLQPAAWVKRRINEKGSFEAYGEGWFSAPQGGIAFKVKTKRLV